MRKSDKWATSNQDQLATLEMNDEVPDKFHPIIQNKLVISWTCCGISSKISNEIVFLDIFEIFSFQIYLMVEFERGFLSSGQMAHSSVLPKENRDWFLKVISYYIPIGCVRISFRNVTKITFPKTAMLMHNASRYVLIAFHMGIVKFEYNPFFLNGNFDAW